LSPLQEMTRVSALLKITEKALMVCPNNLHFSFPVFAEKIAIDLSY